MVKHPTKYSWTVQDIEKLKKYVTSGATAARAAGALNRKILSVQVQARKLGIPFQTIRKARRSLMEAGITSDAKK